MSVDQPAGASVIEPRMNFIVMKGQCSQPSAEPPVASRVELPCDPHPSIAGASAAAPTRRTFFPDPGALLARWNRRLLTKPPGHIPQFKLVLVGDGGVGKREFLLRHANSLIEITTKSTPTIHASTSKSRSCTSPASCRETHTSCSSRRCLKTNRCLSPTAPPGEPNPQCPY